MDADAEVQGAQAAPEDPLVGRLLGGVYRLTERIGHGGMGVVYAARHERLGRSFAVKLLTRGEAPTPSPESLERFRQEAVQASQIEHDHIVDVVHFDQTEEGDTFLVMELLRGESLAALLAREGRLPLERALRIVFQVGDALSAAHARGIVHRDLKPENVFLLDKGGLDFAKVLDFGISKVRTEDVDQVRVTKTGQLLGTPLYMSPEQARGETERVDHRADVYALGCILYEALTGTPPFEGKNHYQLLWKHGQEPPEPPSARAPDAGVPPGVERAILRALDKDPDRRFPSMEAFLDALPEVEAPAPSSSSSRRVRVSGSAPADERERPYGLRRFALELAVLAFIGLALVLVSSSIGALRRGSRGERAAPAAPATAEAATSPTAPGAAGQEAAAAGEARGAAAGRDPAPAVRGVPLRFESIPPGARVLVDGRELLGRTPLVAPVPPSDVPRVVRFELEGHRAHEVRVFPTANARVVGRLARERPAPPRAEPTPPALPFKQQY